MTSYRERLIKGVHDATKQKTDVKQAEQQPAKTSSTAKRGRRTSL